MRDPRIHVRPGAQLSIKLAPFGQCRADAVATNQEPDGVLVSCGSCGASAVVEPVNASGLDARGIDPNNTKGA